MGGNLSFDHFEMSAGQRGHPSLFDAVVEPRGDHDVAMLFFLPEFEPGQIQCQSPFEIIEEKTINAAVVAQICMPHGTDVLPLLIAGQGVEVLLSPPLVDAFEGDNVLMATRNGEPAERVVDFISYHAEYHGAQSALILSRERPDEGPAFIKTLHDLCSKIKGLRQILVVTANFPLGDPTLPSEAHPYNVPSAPGKDRMTLPKPDPWTSPLGLQSLYELFHRKFLSKARAVANLEVNDLVHSDQGTMFDAAVASQNGSVMLLGTPVFPWRVREGDTPHFADHVCVQFDSNDRRRRWCVAPLRAPETAIWRLTRVVRAEATETEVIGFHRYMALRHPNVSASKLAPKTSLIEDAALLKMARKHFKHKPVRPPKLDVKAIQEKAKSVSPETAKTTIITTMKNEGPFILEWLAYHRVIGVTDFLVYTNDCTDGTDTMFDLLQDKGILQHRENPFKSTDLKPQHAALQAGEDEDIIKNADWVVCMDVDEFINIHVGDGTLKDLYRAVPDANMISMTWRLLGNGDVHEYADEFLLEQFTQSAPELARKPHQAWGFKTLHRTLGIYNKLGVHRPKGLNPQYWDQVHWVNGSGRKMPKTAYRNAWRSTVSTYGYDLVSLNHYAVRSAESFLVKRDRGRVNHVDRDQGISYWFRMNNNYEENRTIQRMIPRVRAEFERLLEDPDIRAAHEFSVDAHRTRIKELRATENYETFYGELTGDRMEKLARLHTHFGANVFLQGPQVVPEDILNRTPEGDWFFTVEDGETTH
ncbi:MAG: glycosyltransferase family 2 protein [Halocynthiibacter sp.]